MHILESWLPHNSVRNDTERCRHVLDGIMQALPDAENLQTEDVENRVSFICTRLSKYWKQVQRSKTRLIAKYGDWLNEREICVLKSRPLREVTNSANPSTSQHQHRKKFEDCSKRTKRRRLADLAKVDDSAVHALLSKSNQSDSNPIEFCTDDVVSLFNEAKLTKHQYLLLRDFIHSKLPNVLPSYQKVLEAKKRCYPSGISVTESSAEINLQCLLDHTCTRILESQKSVLDNISESSINEFELVGKWGFDGSTGHSEYKQSFSDSRIEDGSLIVTSYVPLQLICKSNTSDPHKIIWKNPRPSSTRFCRPIRFQFAKETKEISVQEEEHFKNAIDNLNPTLVNIDNRSFKVSHSLQLTMVDGKVCCALSDSSASKCYICGATPKEMNDLEKCTNKQVDPSRFQFGLSPLHSWIRFFEYFIHISYRIEFKKWQARSSEDKARLAERKELIQKQFRERLGLIVDKPRSGGSGTSNDGNTARKFFLNSTISSEITGINKDVIDRCCHLLQCLSSGYKINSDKFKIYALDTAKILVSKYSWYNLPASVHKVLIHGSEVIDHCLLSIGELSEEAAESCNKLVKQFRRDNTRKHSRDVTNTDLLHRLLLNSDPLISSLRKLPRKKKSVLSREVLDLLR